MIDDKREGIGMGALTSRSSTRRTYGMTKHKEDTRWQNIEEALEVKDTFGMEDLAVVGRAEKDSEE